MATRLCVACKRQDEAIPLDVAERPSCLHSAAILGFAQPGTAQDETDLGIDVLERAIPFLFSWIMLLPISVIVSGKLLSQRFKLLGGRGQVFRIPLPPIFRVSAEGDEVILGVAGYIVTLLLVGLFAGGPASNHFIKQFGINPGQFNALSILASFTTVTWSFALVIIGTVRQKTPNVTSQSYDRAIEDLSKRNLDHAS